MQIVKNVLAQKSKFLKFKHTEYQPKKYLLHDWKKKKKKWEKNR